jgi:NAD(P)-dependent dehydrogenase (short-subunit alcohol dehydrogenase family)
LTSIPGWGVDVLDEARGAAAVGTALQRVGRIDVVVSNAGRGCRSQLALGGAEASDAGNLSVGTDHEDAASRT